MWRALTQPKQLEAWFPDTVVGEFDGEVLAFEPGELIELRWGTDTIRFELEPDGGG